MSPKLFLLVVVLLIDRFGNAVMERRSDYDYDDEEDDESADDTTP